MAVGGLVGQPSCYAQTTTADSQTAQSQFVAAFGNAFSPGLASSVVDWISKKVFGASEGTAQRLNDASLDKEVTTLAVLIEAHGVSEDGLTAAKLTREGSNEISLQTDDRFVLKFTANAPGLLRVENVDATRITTELGMFAIPAREEVIVPKSKAFRMVGEPGEEVLRLVFYPCRAYSAALVKTRGVVNENQASSMAESDQMLKTSTLSAVEDCSQIDPMQKVTVATRGVQNENFSGGIALISTAKSTTGKILPVERTIKVIHKAKSAEAPREAAPQNYVAKPGVKG